MSARMVGRMAGFEGALARLPVVSFKTLQLATLDYGFWALGVGLCFIPSTHVAPQVYTVLASLLAALHGVNLYAFRTATQSTTTSASGQQIAPAAKAKR